MPVRACPVAQPPSAGITAEGGGAPCVTTNEGGRAKQSQCTGRRLETGGERAGDCGLRWETLCETKPSLGEMGALGLRIEEMGDTWLDKANLPVGPACDVPGPIVRNKAKAGRDGVFRTKSRGAVPSDSRAKQSQFHSMSIGNRGVYICVRVDGTGKRTKAGLRRLAVRNKANRQGFDCIRGHRSGRVCENNLAIGWQRQAGSSELADGATRSKSHRQAVACRCHPTLCPKICTDTSGRRPGFVPCPERHGGLYMRGRDRS